MNRNRSIDAVRAIACVFVLFVHCPFPGAFGVCVSALARFAVPFFLMVSGYYAFRETKEKTLESARARLCSTAKLTLAGTVFYAISNTLRQTLYGEHPLSWLSSLLSLTGMRRFLIFNRAVFLSSVMYYLFGLIYVYALFMLFIRTKTLRIACAFIPVLLAANVLLNEFLLQPWYYAGNFLLTGLPFFLLGYQIAARGLRIPRPHLLILPGALLSCLETRLNPEMYCTVGTLLLSMGVFFTCLSCPQGVPNDRLVRFGRECSVILFIIHCAVRDYVQMLLPAALPLRDWLAPVTVLAVSIALSRLWHAARIRY